VKPSRARAIGVAMLVALPAAIVGVGAHAAAQRARRAGDQPAIDALAPRLPGGDLALSGGARWLRDPGLAEPGAAFQDGPALPDPDPAGGAMAPPREVWARETRRGAP
jgi:hypothetical protein